jgi:hypothetical protein
MAFTLLLELDELDAAEVHRAIAVRQKWGLLPIDPDEGSNSDRAGSAIAEICRDWLWRSRKPLAVEISEVLTLRRRGASVKQIAKRLFMDVKTVKEIVQG